MFLHQENFIFGMDFTKYLLWKNIDILVLSSNYVRRYLL